ncbi:MAG: VCBS repeat-containing protein [bacterium]|nr:VCBS repeat-containing protein [bacterium]
MKHLYIFFLISAGVLYGLSPVQATTEIDLADVPRQYDGNLLNESFGQELSPAGDVNGDGYDDFLMGSFDESPSDTLFVHLMYGSATGPVADYSSAPVFTDEDDFLEGAPPKVAAAGDVNGDGYDDFLFSDAFDGNAKGVVYLVYGQASKFTGTNVLSSTAVKFTGEAIAQHIGVSIAGAGDINNDGYDDILIGSHWQNTKTGATYVVYGQSADLSGGDLGTVADAKITGEAINNRFGNTVAPAGDLNNDGYDDFVVGASEIGTYGGAVYIFYGKSAQFTDGGVLARATAKISPEETYDGLGYTMNNADLNNDGYDDLLVGSTEGQIGDSIDHGMYVFYGKSANFANINASTADAKFTVADAGTNVFYYVGSSGDINKDGYDDIIVGVKDKVVSSVDTGAAFVFYGSATRFTTAIMAAQADDSRNITASFTSADLQFNGEISGDGAGAGVTNAGDTNGDGFPEILVGAPYWDNITPQQVGRAYLAFPYIDGDGDGLAGPDGLLTGSDTNDNDADNDGIETGTDCDDADDTISENQTYYEDGDDDGLGVSDGDTTSVCSVTAPDGYADNTDDTNDSIKTNGIEIDNDGVDNDDDGEIDEVNTVAENGEHPHYGEYSAKNSDLATEAIVSVTGKKHGRVNVRYADDSVYRYEPFTAYDGVEKTRVKQFRSQGRYIVMHPKGRKIILMNAMNGNNQDTKKIGGHAFKKSNIKVLEFRDMWFAVATLKKGSSVRLVTVRIKPKNNSLAKKSAQNSVNSKVQPSKTKKNKHQIRLRSSKLKVLQKYVVTRDYELKLK